MTNKEMALNIYTVRKAKNMYMKMLEVMAFIEKNKEVANLDLFGATGATPVILEALEQGKKNSSGNPQGRNNHYRKIWISWAVRR